MQSAVLLYLAFGLLAVDSVVASPCRPITTAAITSVASIETSSTASVESATSVETAVASAIIETSVTIQDSSSVESSVETSVSSTTESFFETSAFSTTEMLTSSSTTEFTTTTVVSTTETTTTAAVAVPTFSIIATGQGSVEGKSLQSYPRANTVVAFDLPSGGSSVVPSARPYSIDAQGRLVDDQGFFLCGVYNPTRDLLNAPAEVGTCSDEEDPLTSAFLTCHLTADIELQCSIPAISCTVDNPDNPFELPNCVAATGTWSSLYVRYLGAGYVLHVGDAIVSSYFDPIELSVQEV